MIAVRLAVHAREQIEDFTAHVRELPGVLSVFHMTGVTDYLVWVAAADAQDLREFVVDHLATHPAVAHAETSLIYEHRRGPGVWGAADPAHCELLRGAVMAPTHRAASRHRFGAAQAQRDHREVVARAAAGRGEHRATRSADDARRRVARAVGEQRAQVLLAEEPAGGRGRRSTPSV